VPRSRSNTKAITGPTDPTKSNAYSKKLGEPKIRKPTSARKMVKIISDGVFQQLAPPLGLKYLCKDAGKKAPRRGNPKE
jgi:hypothetical protein